MFASDPLYCGHPALFFLELQLTIVIITIQQVSSAFIFFIDKEYKNLKNFSYKADLFATIFSDEAIEIN
jgi:hypothetical protein